MGASFKELLAWQRAMELAREIYKLSGRFPDTERFGLISQMRRAAVSVPSNIAEGYARSSTGEYIQFLGHARGSCAELETQILLAKDLGFTNEEDSKSATDMCSETGKLVHRLIKSLRQT
ncbi:MAG TPA: four helix bundle protein [Terracidiphilus sp.]